jgi:tetratricopeptide (TPR) repeat protein
VTSRADAERAAGEIEALLDGGHWAEADDVYVTRCGVFRNLPAARLGLRAAAAFVASPSRRAACPERLSPGDLSFYLNDAGLHAMQAGDLALAREYLSAAVGYDREAGSTAQLSVGLRNLAECLARTGLPGPAGEAAREALEWAERSLDSHQVRNAHACVAWLASLAGHTEQADEHFLAADRLEFAGDPGGHHLYSNRGVWWAEHLARTGRTWAARLLTDDNESLCRRNGWNGARARCERLQGLFELEDEDGLTEAAGYLTSAAGRLRDGDCLPDLAETLMGLATLAIAAGDPGAAAGHLAEAMAIAEPRGLVATQCAALTIRARLRGSGAVAGPRSGCGAALDGAALDGAGLDGAGPDGAGPDGAGPDRAALDGRADADAALTLATSRGLPWSELDALRAHAALDEAVNTDHGWAARAAALEARLIPPGLDRDPMRTVEHLASGQSRRQD